MVEDFLVVKIGNCDERAGKVKNTFPNGRKQHFLQNIVYKKIKKQAD